ncbi:MAG TPA: diguanylate cyclase [Vicinamibacteria bacterium]|nr:diguanylate cyclase [Vicinamibacteria bacterium]
MEERDDLAAAELFELKLLFFRELADGYREAREQQERFLRSPGDHTAIDALVAFFHRIAGTAHMVQLPLLGHLAALCERAVSRSAAGTPSDPREAAQLVAHGLAGVAAALDAHGSGATERPLDGMKPLFQGLSVPAALGTGRELSKVLVVDDDRLSAELVDGVLRSAGFVSSYTCDPEQALATIEAELPDLIVMDVMMPAIDGFELCRRVRQHPALQFTPIIFVTRKGELEERVRGLEVGGNDYIAKPFEPQELVARVRSHLNRLAVLREMAIRDGLTQCYNHKFFRLRMGQEVARAHRYGQPLTLAMIDVDRFKTVNDTYGHRAGDMVLSHLGGIVVASVRATDVVARYGGEEFAILMIHAGAEEAKVVCSRLRERIATHGFVFSGDDERRGQDVTISVTVSIGIAELTPKPDSVETLLGRADSALYAAKHAGRDCVRLFVPTTAGTPSAW